MLLVPMRAEASTACRRIGTRLRLRPGVEETSRFLNTSRCRILRCASQSAPRVLSTPVLMRSMSELSASGKPSLKPSMQQCIGESTPNQLRNRSPPAPDQTDPTGRLSPELPAGDGTEEGPPKSSKYLCTRFLIVLLSTRWHLLQSGGTCRGPRHAIQVVCTSAFGISDKTLHARLESLFFLSSLRHGKNRCRQVKFQGGEKEKDGFGTESAKRKLGLDFKTTVLKPYHDAL
nr:PREDICTED: uncharacterized protein LOC106703398 [Latimeria chalumnae]|eukprot:XP_014343647.1 PREDICTED: uncharacterized protein LOC106703398 [Latimeria chalumnae]